MPNWCSCMLTITGPKKDLAAFEATMNKPDHDGKPATFSFHQTVPMPRCILRGEMSFEEQRKSKGANWYDWSVRYWGTKWDAAEPCVKRTRNSIRISFDTAWSPPAPWLESVSKFFPNLIFRLACSESGMAFYGTLTAQEGSVEDDMKEITPPDPDDPESMDPDWEEFMSKEGVGTGG